MPGHAVRRLVLPALQSDGAFRVTPLSTSCLPLNPSRDARVLQVAVPATVAAVPGQHVLLGGRHRLATSVHPASLPAWPRRTERSLALPRLPRHAAPCHASPYLPKPARSCHPCPACLAPPNLDKPHPACLPRRAIPAFPRLPRHVLPGHARPPPSRSPTPPAMPGLAESRLCQVQPCLTCRARPRRTLPHLSLPAAPCLAEPSPSDRACHVKPCLATTSPACRTVARRAVTRHACLVKPCQTTPCHACRAIPELALACLASPAALTSSA